MVSFTFSSGTYSIHHFHIHCIAFNESTLERQKGLINKMELKDLSLLDAVFFVSSFDAIVDESGFTETEVEQTLIALLKKEYIDQMSFDDMLKDYLVKDDHDLDRIRDYHYVATKKGLLKANVGD